VAASPQTIGKLAGQSFENAQTGRTLQTHSQHGHLYAAAALYTPGTYVTISHNTIVGSAASLRFSTNVARLAIGTEVEALKVLIIQSEHRIRAKIRHPRGWISLVDTSTGWCWAEQKVCICNVQQSLPSSPLVEDEEISTRSTIGEWETIERSKPFRPHTVSSYRHGRSTLFQWTVDGKKLQGNGRLIVSPVFHFSEITAKGTAKAPPIPLKMMLTPLGDSSYGRVLGHGTVQVKCEAARHESPNRPLEIFLAVSDGRSHYDASGKRGPERHIFSDSAVFGLRTNKVWDFLKYVDNSTQTFVISLEIVIPVEASAC
jgi:hypothetical protein